MKIEDLARICYEANRTLCLTQSDFSRKRWEEADEWERQTSIEAVNFILENPEARASMLHDFWMRDKTDHGWVYGKNKDPDEKTHPSLIPYEELSEIQKAKDYLVIAIVNGLSKFIER